MSACFQVHGVTDACRWCLLACHEVDITSCHGYCVGTYFSSIRIQRFHLLQRHASARGCCLTATLHWTCTCTANLLFQAGPLLELFSANPRLRWGSGATDLLASFVKAVAKLFKIVRQHCCSTFLFRIAVQGCCSRLLFTIAHTCGVEGRHVQ